MRPGPNSGAGRCYYKMSAGAYYTNSSVYAAANLISNGTPNKPVSFIFQFIDLDLSMLH